jgi:hypothetical protein
VSSLYTVPRLSQPALRTARHKPSQSAPCEHQFAYLMKLSVALTLTQHPTGESLVHDGFKRMWEENPRYSTSAN